MESIASILSGYESGAACPVEVCEIALAAARANRSNEYITLCEDRARARAEKLRVRIRAGEKIDRSREPLFGIPIGLKDNLLLEGVRTTAASRILHDFIPVVSATAVERIEAAGGVVVGKQNMDEFGMGGASQFSAFGPVLHPTHPAYIAGGSSGGSAAAVVQGSAMLSLGSDTGGSVRLPAAYCGVVGFKPSYGRVSRSGLISYGSSLDQIGPIAARVADVAVALEVISGQDLRDSTSVALPPVRLMRMDAPEKRRKFGIPKLVKEHSLMQELAEVLRDAGHEVVVLDLASLEFVVAAYYVIAMSEAASNLARYDGVRFGTRPERAPSAQKLEAFYEEVRALFGSEVRKRILLGTHALSSGYREALYQRACGFRAYLAQEWSEVFSRVDAVLSPVSVAGPIRVEALGQTSALTAYLNDQFTVPANLAGLPAVSLPWGKDERGLPKAIQLQGPRFGDEALLELAQSLESLRDRELRA